MFLLLEEKTSSIVAKATNHKPLEPSPISRKTNYLSPGNSATVVQKFCSELFSGFCPCISVLELGTRVENCAGSDVNLQTENDGQEMLLRLGERSTVTPLFRHAKALKSCVQQNFNEFILYFVFTPKMAQNFPGKNLLFQVQAYTIYFRFPVCLNYNQIIPAGTKTRTGQEHGHKRAFQPKTYATGNERCPVRLFKKFKSHRPSEMSKVDSPLFLAIKYKRAPDDNTWYMKCPLGKNQIGKFLSTAAKNVGIPQVSGAKVTNHSVRKTSISRLLDANMPENFVAQHSSHLGGHKSTESLQSYKSAGEKNNGKCPGCSVEFQAWITQPRRLRLVLLPVFCKCVSQTIKPHVHLST